MNLFFVLENAAGLLTDGLMGWVDLGDLQRRSSGARQGKARSEKMATGWLKGTVKAVPSGDSLLIMGSVRGGPPPEKTITLAALIAPKLVSVGFAFFILLWVLFYGFHFGRPLMTFDRIFSCSLV